MHSSFEILEAEALKLNAVERARLAEHLIASLDEDSEIEHAWAAEIERRIAGAEAGAIAVLSAEEAIATARAAVK